MVRMKGTPLLSDIFSEKRGINLQTLEQVILLALEIAREGREGRRIGAFIVSDDGIVLSACRYINATSEDIELPLGFGSRLMAAASITKRTNAVAVVISKSSVIRIFDDGELISEITPES